MKNPICLLLVLFVLGAVLAACGGGGGGGTPPAPTITSVQPNQGPLAGGTVITLTGTGYGAGATVTVGGAAATSVVVADTTSLTCTTPAGSQGAAAVVVTVNGLSGTLAAGFTYSPLPTITSVAPSGPTGGGTGVFITGTGFTAGGAGANTVTIGGAPATAVVTIDDTTLTCVTPAGTAGPADTIVTNAIGSSAPFAGFVYFVPIYAAEGGGNPAPTTYMFSALDPQSGLDFPIGPIGFGVTGMDFHPTTGTLYAVTAPGSTGGPRQLITIDPTTGAGTLVGPLNDAVTPTFNHIVTDCAFHGGVLYGVTGSTQPTPSLVTINTANGVVTVVAPNATAAPGGGFAVDATSTNTFYMTADNAPIVLVSVLPTPGFVFGPNLNSFVIPSGRIGAACFHQGFLHVVDAGPNAGQREFLIVDTTTGTMTHIGALASTLIGAIASTTR